MKKGPKKIPKDILSLLKLRDEDVDLEILESLDLESLQYAGEISFENIFIILVKSVRQLRKEMNLLKTKEGVRALIQEDLKLEDKLELTEILLDDLKDEIKK